MMALWLSSTDFTHNGSIPTRFTCEGNDVSPALEWHDQPPGTQSFALILDDPDVPDPANPQRIWVHWVLYNIPASARALPQAARTATLPAGTRSGLNDWKRADYGGPCPPVGRHRYFFQLYALDCVLPDLHDPTKAQLEAAMEGHTLEKAEILCTYQKAAGGRR
jgi:Raf kinase inhibitor-like YbhB/YbcL family protein